MARQVGEIKHQGAIGGIIYYKSPIGDYLAREKGGVDAHRIATDPAFECTRKNNTEFKGATSAVRLLRSSVRSLSKKAEDCCLCSRLTKVLMQVKNLDVSHVHGERNVADGLATLRGKQLLTGFNFNINAPLHGVLYKSVKLVPATGEIIIEKFSPLNDLKIPHGSTHILFKAGRAVIDFATDHAALAVAKPVRLPVAAEEHAVNLLPDPLPAATGVTFMVLCIEFVQEINGEDYPPAGKAADNVMCIVGVG